MMHGPTNVKFVKTRILYRITFFQISPVYEIAWKKNLLELGRPQTAIGPIILRMRSACWISKATDIHSPYVIGLLTAFLRQQWLRERASMLRLHVHCLACLVSYRNESRSNKFAPGDSSLICHAEHSGSSAIPTQRSLLPLSWYPQCTSTTITIRSTRPHDITA